MARAICPVLAILFLVIPARTLIAADAPPKLPFVEESKHYIIKSNIDKQTCRSLAPVMDKLYEELLALFPITQEQKTKTEILIFSNRTEFRTYCESVGEKIGEDTSGLFRGKRGGASEILTFQHKMGEFDTTSILYHEATHQFIAMMMGRHKPPRWVNEGVAVYFEQSEWKGGKLLTGGVPKTRLALLKTALKANKHVPLAELLKRDGEKYDLLCYSEGWSLVYFFIKANKGIYGKRLGTYLKIIKDGKNPDDAFKECFPAELPKLEAAWKEFVLEHI